MHNKTERNMEKENKSARNEIKDTLLLQIPYYSSLM